MQGRFRPLTIARALDVLREMLNQAQMVALIEELGCGDEYDRSPAPNRTTPKMRNLLQQAVRRDPSRTDIEGVPLGDAIVRHAARHLPLREAFRHAASDGTLTFQFAIDFIASLAVDGWAVERGKLIPAAPSGVRKAASRLKTSLAEAEFSDALTRLDQLEHGLDDGHWESANGDARAFLSSVFSGIAKRCLGELLEEGKARRALVTHGFFKRDVRDPNSSLEGEFVQKLMNMLGSEGAHTGPSDESTAVYRYGVAVLTADYFLARHRRTR